MGFFGTIFFLLGCAAFLFLAAVIGDAIGGALRGMAYGPPRQQSDEERYLHSHGGVWHSHVHHQNHFHPDPDSTIFVNINDRVIDQRERH